MYSMLVVDDEKYAVEAIVSCIDWEAVGVTSLYAADGAASAMERMAASPVDIILCDIEMPGRSGMELLQWVNGNYPDTVTIIITGHADFAYAQKAVQLGSFDYLLKPIRRKQLAEVVNRALEKLVTDREERCYAATYRKYAQLWETQQPLLREKFWQDMLGQKVIPPDDQIRRSIETCGMPIDADMPIRPVMLSVEQFRKAFDRRDEDIMEYALRNAAEELFLQNAAGAVVRDRSGLLFVLIYGSPERPLLGEDRLETICREYIAACASFFYCSLSCYIGEPVPVGRLSESRHRLVELEQGNVSEPASVRFQRQERQGGLPQLAPVPIDWSEWTVLFEAGKKEELLGRLDDAFRELERQPVTPETLESVYHMLLHMIYHVSHRRGWSAKEAVGSRLLTGEAAATRSVARLKSWAGRILSAGFAFFDSQEVGHHAAVEKVKRYVQDHIKDVNREDVAAAVYLNPAYLSRLFKKETGQSLMDFILATKVGQAKVLLTETNMKISDIGDELGYDNFSYFGKLFKKIAGVTPQEYRKRYQDMEG